MPLFQKTIDRRNAMKRADRRRLDLLDTARVLAVEKHLSFITEPKTGAVMIMTPDRTTRILVDPFVTKGGMVPRISVITDEPEDDRLMFNMSSISVSKTEDLTPEEMLVHVLDKHTPVMA